MFLTTIVVEAVMMGDRSIDKAKTALLEVKKDFEERTGNKLKYYVWYFYQA